MTGDEFRTVIDAEPVRIHLQRDGAAGEAGRDRVAVAVEGHPELAIGAHRQDPSDIERARVEGLQLGVLLGP